ncbi:MAG: hypothetical protein IT319_22140 [Anaerolineae bacterium]|nr:hypothetical protein [Anaerolineae bacterium]
MKKSVLLAAMLILCVSGAAYAQTTVPVFCGDLAQEDCDLLTRSQEVMRTLDSAAFDFNMNLTISNVPDMEEPLAITIMGSGAYSGASNISSDSAVMESDPAQGLLEVLDNLDFNFSMTVTVPPELVQEVDPNAPNSLTLELSMVDGVGYLNLDTLQALLSDLGDSGMSGWVGLDLAGFVRALMEEMPDLFSGMSAATMDSVDMQAYIEQFSDPALLGEFMTVEKVDLGMPDEETFRFTLDFGSLMSTPAFRDLMMDAMREQLEAQGQTLSQSEMDQALAMSSQMLKNMTFVIDETIGVEDAFVRAVHATFSLDMASMMAVMDSGKESKDEPAPAVAFDLTLFSNSFNSVPPITAPEDAMVFPYESLLEMLGGMSNMSMQTG